jgi:hypothetical protein
MSIKIKKDAWKEGLILSFIYCLAGTIIMLFGYWLIAGFIGDDNGVTWIPLGKEILNEILNFNVNQEIRVLFLFWLVIYSTIALFIRYRNDSFF